MNIIEYKLNLFIILIAFLYIRKIKEDTVFYQVYYAFLCFYIAALIAKLMA